ncbi:MAG: FecCD family ABC transporter permease [Sarcina sp.]
MMENKTLRKEKFDFYKKRNLKKLKILVGLLVLLIIVSIVSISKGASGVGIDVLLDFFKETIYPGTTNIELVDKIVIMDIRLPRVFVAIFVGIALASSGLLMQGIFQNPLVSPYTLGISNGAAFGAALSIILGVNLSFIGSYGIPIFAFIFAIITMVLVYIISLCSKNSSKSLILSGVAIGYLFSAMVSFLKYVSDSDELPEIVFWMMGGMSGVSWENIFIIMAITIVGLIIMFRYSWDLNIMALGEETAKSMGVNYSVRRNTFMIIATLMTAVAVAFTGIIGFVGIIAPHISRIILGSDYRYLIPGTALIGALLLLISDTVARNMLAPTELPVGIITSFIGVPFFIYLIIKQKRG